jgi:hypothetical protein
MRVVVFLLALLAGATTAFQSPLARPIARTRVSSPRASPQMPIY